MPDTPPPVPRHALRLTGHASHPLISGIGFWLFALAFNPVVWLIGPELLSGPLARTGPVVVVMGLSYAIAAGAGTWINVRRHNVSVAAVVFGWVWATFAGWLVLLLGQISTRAFSDPSPWTPTFAEASTVLLIAMVPVVLFAPVVLMRAERTGPEVAHWPLIDRALRQSRRAAGTVDLMDVPLQMRGRVATLLVWAIAGPLNPMALFYVLLPDLAPRFVEGAGIISLVTLPAAVMSSLVWWGLRGRAVFSAADVLVRVCIAFGITVALSPVIVFLPAAVQTGGDGSIGVFFIIAVFGWLFGVIPYYAMAVGAPCAILAWAIWLTGTRRVR